MRLLFIRHGDPDYEHDTLTEKGDHEAELLSGVLAGEHIDEIYKSPLGRAQRTAMFTEKKTGIKGQTKDWLREFPNILHTGGDGLLQRVYPDTEEIYGSKDGPRILWDMLPSYLVSGKYYLDNENWRRARVSEVSRAGDMYESVTAGFDELLSEHGYVREGMLYRVEKENTKTLALFCHFGVQCVLLSHLWNCSPFILWHFLGIQTSSVTEAVTEEREQGTAIFRALRIGDISHLKEGNEPPSFAGRFCEVYSDMSERH